MFWWFILLAEHV